MSPSMRLISWPFHNGSPNVGMGRGPGVLAGDETFSERLAEFGWELSLDEVEPADRDLGEVARVAELARRLAAHVADAVAAHEFPLVLAGGCNSCLGTVAGMGSAGSGVVWFDAHADFDTPDENVSGFLDVMGLSMLTGGSWQALCSTIPGFAPVSERAVLLAGVRDLEPYQRVSLERSDVRTAPGAIDPARFAAELEAIAAQADRVYLHIDLDVLDSGEAIVNEYAASGGPTVDHLVELVESVFETVPVTAAALTAWDPAYDADGAALAAAGRMAEPVARGALAER
jgi:arginase